MRLDFNAIDFYRNISAAASVPGDARFPCKNTCFSVVREKFFNAFGGNIVLSHAVIPFMNDDVVRARIG